MAIILDADVIIEGEKGRFNLSAWLDSLPGESFEIAAITVAELWHGLERATPQHKVARQRYLTGVVESFPIIAYTEQTAYAHARIWAALKTAGRMIGYYDLILAATAIERDSQLATFNKRDFTRVKGLRILEPR